MYSVGTNNRSANADILNAQNTLIAIGLEPWRRSTPAISARFATTRHLMIKATAFHFSIANTPLRTHLVVRRIILLAQHFVYPYFHEVRRVLCEAAGRPEGECPIKVH